MSGLRSVKRNLFPYHRAGNLAYSVAVKTLSRIRERLAIVKITADGPFACRPVR